MPEIDAAADRLRQEWFAWPRFRTREQALAADAANLKVAHTKRILLIERAAVQVAKALREGRQAGAYAILTAALREEADGDQTLTLLRETLERLEVHDLGGARDAQQKAARFVHEQAVFSTAANVATADLESVIATRFRLIEETILRVSLALREGRQAEAFRILNVALRQGFGGDQSLSLLKRVIDRLRVQDFKGASDACQRAVHFVNDQADFSGAVKAAIADMEAAIAQERAANHAAQRRIATEISTLIDLTKKRESKDFAPELKGKVMIWDATKGEVQRAYELLPDKPPCFASG